jgi:HlyD family secretion protein
MPFETEVQAPRRKRHIWLIAGVAVLVVVSSAFTLFHHNGSTVQYFTEEVNHGPLKTIVNATGIVQAVVTVQVGSQVSGQIQALYADYNSIVRRGALLAKIDPRNYQAQVDDSKANLAAAQAHVRSAEADLKTQQANLESAKANVEAARVARDNDAITLHRYSEMVKDGIVAQGDYDAVRASAATSQAKYDQAVAAAAQVEAQINASKAQLEQARAQVQQAQAELDKALVTLEYTSICSPVDGVVISRSVDVGQTVAASLQAPLLFVIANDLTKMQVNASVDEADIGHITPSAIVQFTVDAFPNDRFSGKIAEVRLNPQTVQNVVTYSVIISVDNTALKLKPGMTANIAMITDSRANVVKLPNAALRYLPPGMTRDSELALLHTGNENPLLGGIDQSRKATSPRIAELPRSDPEADRAGIAGADRKGPPVMTDPIPQAPGQMWNWADKIKFPMPGGESTKAAMVWVLGPTGKPEPRQVRLGITDGSFTEVVGGNLPAGGLAIIADSTQAATENPQGGMRTPFGFGGRRAR